MCCPETGNAGLGILSAVVILCFFYGVGLFFYAALIFFREEVERSRTFAYVHMAVVIVLGLIVCLGAIIAAFFDLNLNAGYAGFAIVFFVQCIVELSLIYAFKMNKVNSWANTLILGITPVFQGLVVIGIIFLLVEDEALGLTAMMIIIAIVIVVNFCHGFGLILCAIYFFVRREAEEVDMIKIVALLVGAIAVLVGAALACFFRLSNVTAIVGFSIVLLVQGLILAWFAYPYWTRGREYHSILRLLMLGFSALFAGLTFIGILAAAIRIILGAEI